MRPSLTNGRATPFAPSQSGRPGVNTLASGLPRPRSTTRVDDQEAGDASEIPGIPRDEDAAGLQRDRGDPQVHRAGVQPQGPQRLEAEDYRLWEGEDGEAPVGLVALG